ncbi:tetratricopeptide repeat protein [Pseudovibrio sp. Alg231-02]|uniref:tetratricopeptide repeat protein n=1 Tax=Pseudovibrio sp. Alg231-02 TaxID=1922223 RepID=UPI000D55D62C|nr:tetratricopeptide repeat protein [Pseudovibrio sp. Alg231-02]
MAVFDRTHTTKMSSGILRSATAVSLLLVCGLALSGCATNKPRAQASISQNQQLKPGSQEMQKALAYWGGAYAKDQKNPRTILNFAAALRIDGQGQQAEAILRRGVIANADNNTIAASYGKVLAENGKLQEALNVIDNAFDPAQPNWKMLSAKAAILDQLGETKQARSTYQQALKLSPNEPTVLNNLGMSYLLGGDLRNAETTLRTALDTGKAGSQVRQNLALTLGLQGRFDEAVRVAQSDIDPRQAAENVAYLKTMLGKA